MEYEEILHRCFRCGFCKFTDDYQDINCPSYAKVGLDTYSPGGRMWLIYAWAKDEIKTTARYADILYSCMTCGNCKEHCVLAIKDDLLRIFETAKSELVSAGFVPPLVRDYFKSISTHKNPYKEPQKDRAGWSEGAGIEMYSGQEYLFYVGDVGSYDERGKKMAAHVAKLMSGGGISFGILGDHEQSDGNDVKALGEKWLFEQLAADNIAEFKKRHVKKVITLDPHAFNTFRNEYPRLGSDVEVWHYTQILADLIKGKRIPLSENKVKVTYHDPCYLGRHNGIYDAPRDVLRAIPGLQLIDMDRNQRNAFCCGGGGGNFFTDILGTGEESPARIRVKEALQTGADILAVACPMCSKMLDDAVKAENLEERIRVQDIAEIVSQD